VDTYREYARRINDAFLPVTRRTKDEALKKRGYRGGLGQALVSLHARVLADAMQAEPELADVKIEAMNHTMVEVWTVFHDMEAEYRQRAGR
jgi:hypothetical protein